MIRCRENRENKASCLGLECRDRKSVSKIKMVRHVCGSVWVKTEFFEQ